MATIENETSKVEEQAFHGVSTGKDSVAIFGQGAAVGVRGDGGTWHGVAGITSSTVGGAGVHGSSTTGGTGVIGESTTWVGVYGKTDSTTGGSGVMGEGGAKGGPGVIGLSKTWHGVYGETAGKGETGAAAVAGTHLSDGLGVAARSASGTALYAKSDSGRAAVFDGSIKVLGDIEVKGDVRLNNGDCAEDFDIAAPEGVEPGTVMVLGDEGMLFSSVAPYDKRVAGVVAGAGDYRPGIVLDSRESSVNRQPIALLGKTYCKVDAQFGPIEIGDLLTTSSTAGHAMRVNDPSAAVGAMIGKALRPWSAGQGLIPILIALQ